MPTSVLLAVLAAAGLLALAPALVRRYDATERLVAERAASTARVLSRRGARTVPGRMPVNTAKPTPPSAPADIPAPSVSAAVPAVLPPEQLRAWWRGRRRRILLALVLLAAVETAGVAMVGPGFWIGLGVSAVLLSAYLVHLRNRALADRRARRLRIRHSVEVAALARARAVQHAHAERAAVAARARAAERVQPAVPAAEVATLDEARAVNF